MPQSCASAQTARSLRFFAIGEQRMPIRLIRAMALIKWATASHRELGRLEGEQASAICSAAQRVAEGELGDQFPLSGRLRHTLPALHTLAMGGTAVGTGLDTHPRFGALLAHHLGQRLQLPLQQVPNLFAALAGHEALVALHATLRMLGTALAPHIGYAAAASVTPLAEHNGSSLRAAALSLAR